MIDCDEDILIYCLLKHYVANQDLGSIGMNTPWTWLDACLYIDERNNRIPILSEYQRDAGKKAISYYAAAYITKNIQKEQVVSILKKKLPYESVPATTNDLMYEEENCSNNLLKLIETKFNEDACARIEDLGHFVELFRYPHNISYSDETKQCIYDKILGGDFNDEEIAYFLCSDRHSNNCAERLEVLRYIIAKRKPNESPFYDFMIFMACREMSLIHIALSEDSNLEEQFCRGLLDKLDKKSYAYNKIAIDEKEIEKGKRASLTSFIIMMQKGYMPYYSSSRIDDISKNIDKVVKIIADVQQLNPDNILNDQRLLVTAMNDVVLRLCDTVETPAEVNSLERLVGVIKQYWKSHLKEGHIIYNRVDEGLRYAKRRVSIFQNIRKYVNEHKLFSSF